MVISEMGDQDKPSEIELPTLNRLNSSDAQDSVKIDYKLLIDANQLIIGPMISERSYSIVYQGLYKSMPVAVKVIQPDTASMVSPEIHENFNREVSMLSRVNHDNIVKFIGASVEPKMMIITELMKGGTLKNFLWSLRPNRPDLKLAITYALEISQAMEYLHQNRIIHRDLKPSNLLLTEDKKKIKLADFGTAREESDDEMTTEVGTYRWMAPELLSKEAVPGGKKHYNHKVDIYSFSMVLWELLTNTTPFKNRNNIIVAYATVMNKRPSIEHIPPHIVPFLESCWADKPEDRPEFMQITEFLKNFLRSTCLLGSTSPNTEPSLLESEDPRNREENENSPATGFLMDESTENKKKQNWPCPRFPCCLMLLCT